MTRAERTSELVMSLPWLIASCWCYKTHAYALGLAGSFFFFLTGLRQTHSAIHVTLGLSRAGCELALFVLSVLMLNPLHAIQVTHLHHHRHCLEEGDIEGSTARQTGLMAVVKGPIFGARLIVGGMMLAAPSRLRWIACELATISCGIALALVVLDSEWLRWHMAAMLAGNCLTGFFAVWTVHHGCSAGKGLRMARTQRGVLKNVVSYNLFYHLEHHLFPAVPTGHLPELAARLDRIAPEIRQQTVF